ncbi:hypothetical protein BaRGS_00031317 [Batillaria attramentaria]|uniref:Selenoprotein M n=1 Tax=Batillaria attramentaria TaxID=370345 RepID=A0ABD0JRX6_9CAEN
MFRLVSPPLEGASTAPTIFLKDERGDVALDVSSLPYDQIKLLLHELGFYRKEDLKDPVPEVYQQGPVPPSGGTTLEELIAGTSPWSKYIIT